MALHDLYARRTPFELAFPEGERADELAESAWEEAAGRGLDPRRPHVFATLGAVASFLGELRDPDAPPESVRQYAALVYHGVHFAREGRPLYRLTTGAVRHLIDDWSAEGPAGEPRPPEPAGYVQLPQHLVWLEEGTEGELPESIDGIFWTTSPDDLLHGLIVTGVRPDRPGVGVVPVPEAPLADASDWLGARVRRGDEGDDFASSIPGASFDRLYGISTAGEPLKLLARLFAYLSASPESVEEEEPADPPSDVAGPAPSRLRARRVDRRA